MTNVTNKKNSGKEWADKSKYNSFNSDKGLMWFDSHYKPIAKWWEGEGDLPAPIELSLDPGHLCNFACSHCNAQRYLVMAPEQVPEDRKLMTREHLRDLIDFVSDWGVRAVCIGGGGEPLMNKGVWDLPSHIAERGMKSSYATNGSIINQEIAEEMMNCRWVGVSLDSGTPETFARAHGIDGKYFNKVIDNVKLLVGTKEKTGSKIDIAYKFLIRPDNWQDLEQACQIAKDIGVRDFHARPVDLERKDYESGMRPDYDIEGIDEMFERCHEMQEGGNFRVFSVRHKYDGEFKVTHGFQNCVSSPLMMQACSDGNVYVCADHRIEERFKLSSHFPEPRAILDVWGSDKHRKLLKEIGVDEECGRCTYGSYARQIEELAMGVNEDDPMCVDFP